MLFISLFQEVTYAVGNTCNIGRSLVLQRDFGLNCHSEALFAEESALASRDSSQTTAQNDKSRCSISVTNYSPQSGGRV